MKTYLVPVIWQMSSVMEVEAKSYEQAMDIAINDTGLPHKADYIDGSFEIEEDSIYYNKEKGNV